MNIKQKFLKLFSLLKLASYELEDGSTIDVVDGIAEIEGQPAPDGEYKATSGETITVAEGVATVSEPPADETLADETPANNTPSEEMQKLLDEITALKAENEALKAKLDSEQLAKAELSKQVTELSKQPSVKKVTLKVEDEKPLSKAQLALKRAKEAQGK
jgi:hypothetical protein